MSTFLVFALQRSAPGTIYAGEQFLLRFKFPPRVLVANDCMCALKGDLSMWTSEILNRDEVSSERRLLRVRWPM